MPSLQVYLICQECFLPFFLEITSSPGLVLSEIFMLDKFWTFSLFIKIMVNIKKKSNNNLSFSWKFYWHFPEDSRCHAIMVPIPADNVVCLSKLTFLILQDDHLLRPSSYWISHIINSEKHDYGFAFILILLFYTYITHFQYLMSFFRHLFFKIAIK